MSRLRREKRLISEPFEYSSIGENLVEPLFKIIKSLSKGKVFKTFLLSVSWPPLTETAKSVYRREVQYSLTELIVQELGKTIDFHDFEAEFNVDFVKKRVFMRLSPLFVKGNYCKFSRIIAQTEHFCPKCKGRGKYYGEFCERCEGKGFLSKESVAQLIGPFFLKEFKAKEYIFHGAGREDADVKMLGNGRPFIIEIQNPSLRETELGKLERKINKKLKDKVSLNSLEKVNKKEVALLKTTEHEKIYSALVSCSAKPELKKLKLNKKIKLKQRTPNRVSKRRVDLIRNKVVEILKTEETKNEKEFILKLKTSHGTYVKEFVSGDEGRTVPSISSMLKINCVCKELDVLEICKI